MARRAVPGGDGPIGDGPIGEIDDHLGRLVRALGSSMVRERVFADAGIELDQPGAAVLSALAFEQAPLRLTDLAARVHTTAGAVTRKVQELELAGLLERHADSGDRRVRYLQLTPAGRQVFDRLRQARAHWLAAVLEDWNPGERSELARVLARFLDCVLGELGS